MFRSSLVFQKARAFLNTIQSKTIKEIQREATREEARARHCKEFERVMQDPAMKAIIEKSTAKAKAQEADPSYQPGRIIDTNGLDSTLKKAEESWKHSVY